jgi:serine/threonine-protein kinase
LHEILPGDVVCNELLMNFCRGLISADPMKRFPDAEAAEMVKEGAAAFHRQLVLGNMSSEYPNEIRLWVEELKEMESQSESL